MRRASVALVFALSMLFTMAFPAIATEVNTSSFEECDGVGIYHFVLNQYDVQDQILTVTIGGVTYNQAPDHQNRGTQHYYVTASGAITAADTSGNGFLVLSDLDCDEGKKGGDEDPKK